jgi:hypothetical protein
MAFDITNQGPTLVENVGINHALQILSGVVALSSGSKVVTLPGVEKVVYANASSQTANAARILATDKNSFTITGTGTDVVMWSAHCIAKT